MLARSQPRRPPVLSMLFLTASCLAGLVVAAGAVLHVKESGALFTNQQPVPAPISAARIFRDERVTPAFSVSDHSSGSAVDGSSANAFANDGRYFLTRTWPSGFASDRYLELDFNAPLPAGLGSSNASATLRVASDAGTGALCVYAELRRASTGALVSSHGSSGSPLACTSGTASSTVGIPLAAVTGTDLANDLRLRIYGSDSAAGALRLDEATVAGETPYASWTLYPVLTRESYSGQVELIPWALAGP